MLFFDIKVVIKNPGRGGGPMGTWGLQGDPMDSGETHSDEYSGPRGNWRDPRGHKLYYSHIFNNGYQESYYVYICKIK